jgi:glycine C-acetyltransferase
MYGAFEQHLADQIAGIRDSGLYKNERVIATPQSARIGLAADGSRVLNMCANNYLGLANHPDIVKAASDALDEWGYGLASVRFICGTQTLHKQLEQRISEFLGTEDTILYGSCFDANGGLFETLAGQEDAIISDALNHASIIDGIRLAKAHRYRYENGNMADLEAKLIEAQAQRFRLIATDGVFSMDGYLAKLPEICDLAEKHNALVMVDDSHAVGFIGPKGGGTPDHFGVRDRIDVITGTLGKALGGASGGYVSGKRAIIELLRQRSRPYLFSNTLAPMIAAASLKCLDLLSSMKDLRTHLKSNTAFFRESLTSLGFQILPGEHPIVPIMLGEATRATTMAEKLLKRGIYVIPFSFPVVPRGLARIRVQISAAHSREDLAWAVEQFAAVRQEMAS